jgi:hypothetical protein
MYAGSSHHQRKEQQGSRRQQPEQPTKPKVKESGNKGHKNNKETLSPGTFLEVLSNYTDANNPKSFSFAHQRTLKGEEPAYSKLCEVPYYKAS